MMLSDAYKPLFSIRLCAGEFYENAFSVLHANLGGKKKQNEIMSI